jgi:hypothetical protein
LEIENGKKRRYMPAIYADNYFFHNELNAEMFEGNDISVFAGPMVTVLGTSLQNRDLLKFFMNQLGGNWFRDGRILLSESHPVSLENKKKCSP